MLSPRTNHFETSVETLFGRTDRPDDTAFLGSTLAAIALRVDELDLAMTAVELDRLRQLERDIRFPVPFAQVVEQVYAEIEAAIPPDRAQVAKARAGELQGREIVTLLEELWAARCRRGRVGVGRRHPGRDPGSLRPWDFGL